MRVMVPCMFDRIRACLVRLRPVGAGLAVRGRLKVRGGVKVRVKVR